MCCEDLKIARQTRATIKLINIDVAEVVAFSANKMRYGLIFSAALTTARILSFNAPTGDIISVYVPAGNNPLICNVREWGDIITWEIRVTAPAGPDVMRIAELTWREDSCPQQSR